MDTLQPIGAILLVLGLLAGALFVLKKRKFGSFTGDLRFGGERRLQVLERVALTPQHMLCLVRVGEKVMMVTTAPQNCQILDAPVDKMEKIGQ